MSRSTPTKLDSLFVSDRRDRQLDRDFFAGFAASRHLDALAEQRALPGLQIFLQSAMVVVAHKRGNDQLGHDPAKGLFPRPFEQSRSAVVPFGHFAVRIHHHDSIERRVEQQAQFG